MRVKRKVKQGRYTKTVETNLERFDLYLDTTFDDDQVILDYFSQFNRKGQRNSELRRLLAQAIQMQQNDGRAVPPKPKAQPKRLNASEGSLRPILPAPDPHDAAIETVDDVAKAVGNFLNCMGG